MKIKDHFLTNEEFTIVPTETAGVLKTVPQPTNLHKYYNSKRYISHHQDDASIKTKIYKFFQKFNLRYKRNIVANYTPHEGVVLDYGCGSGEFLKYIESEFTILGYEPSEAGVNSTINKTNATLIKTIDEIADNSIHTITMWHVLEHIADQEAILNKLYCKLNTGGHLIVAVPNYLSFDAQYYKEYWAAYDVPRHLYHFSNEGLRNTFNSVKWKFKKLQPLLLDALYISIISEQYKKSSLPWLKGSLVGSISNIKALKNNQFSSLVLVIEKK